MDAFIDSYQTLAHPAEAEDRIQRSRFIAHAAPAVDEGQALAAVQAMRHRFHDARHVCHAWRVGGLEAREQRQDDGEPSGTAGEPILLAITGRNLHDVVIAVARYFGGVKLGTGGLSRAYGGVAAAALDAAERRTVLLGQTLRLSFEYAQQKTVEHLLAAHGGRLEHCDYGAAVDAVLWLPNSTWERFAATLLETTAGRLRCERLDAEST